MYTSGENKIEDKLYGKTFRLSAFPSMIAMIKSLLKLLLLQYFFCDLLQF